MYSSAGILLVASQSATAVWCQMLMVVVTVVSEFVVLRVWMHGYAKAWRYFDDFRRAYGHVLLPQTGLAS